MGWLTGYSYRKKGSVVATAAGAQTNYQMQLLVGESSGASGEEVDCENHCQDFPNDIRFTGVDGVTKHDYWVQSITGTTPNRLATIWIEVATIPASGDVDLYMYYGKSSDSGESSGDNTFVIYNMSDVKALWHMDEASWDGTPNEVEDETGSCDGKAVGGVSTSANGKRNRCGGLFDGSDDSIDLDYKIGAELNGASAISFVGWIHNTDLPSVGGLRDICATRINAGTGGLDVMLQHENLIRVAGRSVSTDSYQMKTTTWDTEDQWKHLVGILDFANDRIKIYIDADEKVDEAVTFGNTTYTFGTPTEEDRIGCSPNPLIGAFFKGYLDELALITHGLTQAEVTALHENYMEKMSSYYNIRKWASPAPTWGTWESEVSPSTRCYAFIIS